MRAMVHQDPLRQRLPFSLYVGAVERERFEETAPGDFTSLQEWTRAEVWAKSSSKSGVTYTPLRGCSRFRGKDLAARKWRNFLSRTHVYSTGLDNGLVRSYV
jgi:hypothetical protein